LGVHFKSFASDDRDIEYYGTIKRKLLAQCDLLLEEGDSSKLNFIIKECNDIIYGIISPHIFNDNDTKSITHEIDNSFENLYFIIENETSINNVNGLSVYQFYKRLEIIETRHKQQAQHGISNI
jgi:hypothetical protein